MKKYLFASLMTATVFCFGPIKAYCDDTSAGSSQATMPTESRAPDRVVRRIIAEGSYSNSNNTGDDASRYSHPNGLTAGILADLLGTGNLVLETGALYRKFGTTSNNGFTDNGFTADYISVPVSAKYYFSGQEVTSMYIKGGLMASTLLSNNSFYTASGTQVSARQWETAALAGLGVKISLGTSTDLLLEADYTRSIDSVFTTATVYRSDLSGVVGVAVNL